MNEDTHSAPARILIYSTAAVILTIGMQQISTILVPVFFSVFAYLIFAPLVHWLQRKGVPGTVSVGLVILLFIVVAIASGLLVLGSLLQLSTRIPNYETQLMGILEKLADYLPSAGFSIESILRDIGAFAFGITAGILTGVLDAGTTTGLIIITTTFLLLDAAGAPKKVQKEIESQSFLVLQVTEFGKNLINYIVIRTETNLLGGIGTAVLLLIGGIDFAILWGILTFLLAYIPYIGFILAALPPMLLGLFKYGPLGALAVLAGISLVNALVENVLFPSLAGKGLKLSPSVVFLSLFYWAYVLGTAGALIAIPLTMVVKMILESSEETRWMAKLMESSGSRNQNEEDAG
ncbi:AI-2E family transporter [Methanosarcina sp.]|uniref:AI-2E family transporter n=1 Tax=Methanosarcina sp. TaxID=2213 RepID=UPI002BE11FD7|nr:AI-2E family transporter [Methanosarcina sp.]HOW15028.1 AI-2E family transporter [Methanosarcina sp.]